MSRKKVFAMLLAAGDAQRFGAPKQLAHYRGESLIRHAARAAEHACGKRTLVVLGARWAEAHAACAPLAGFFVINDHAATGMSTSIATGVRTLSDSAAAVLITCCDQPLVNGEDLRRLLDAWNGAPEHIVCASDSGYRGPPALFPSRYFEELQTLRGDRGARSLLEMYRNHVTTVHCAGAAADVDTPEDLAELEHNV